MQTTKTSSEAVGDVFTLVFAGVMGYFLYKLLFRPAPVRKPRSTSGLGSFFSGPSYEELSLTELSDCFILAKEKGDYEFADYLKDIISFKCSNPNYGN